LRPKLKQEFFKILIPFIGSLIALLLVNADSLAPKNLLDIVLFLIGISLLVGLLLWMVNYLIEYFLQKNLKRIKNQFLVEQISENVFKFNYVNIDVYCEQKLDPNKLLADIDFHTPRKFIRKYNRKNFDFIKPSSIKEEDCFLQYSTNRINEKSLNILKHRIQLISDKNET